MKQITYNEILEEIILAQAGLSIAFINYDYEKIEYYSKKIARYIKKILDDNRMLANK